VPTSLEPNRARPRAPDEVGDGVAERALQPGLEREHRAAALVSELAFDEARSPGVRPPWRGLDGGGNGIGPPEVRGGAAS
jgi:hypothetical protein